MTSIQTAASLLVLAFVLPASPLCAQVTSGSGNTEVVIHGTVRKKPEAAPPLLDIYAKPAKYEHVALSPDGDVFAFVTTVDNVHILATYRFSDKSKRAVKLSSGRISTIAFADDDHILVTTSLPGPRGTCGGGSGGMGHSSSIAAANLASAVSAMPSLRSAGPGRSVGRGCQQRCLDAARFAGDSRLRILRRSLARRRHLGRHERAQGCQSRRTPERKRQPAHGPDGNGDGGRQAAADRSLS
ncbi:MAG: hypothetical protein WDN06_16040 [Asticcacaulis sp.]